MPTISYKNPGLTDAQVAESKARFGTNVLLKTDENQLWKTLKEVVTEPMFLLLLAACILYVIMGQTEEAVTLAVALLLVAGISVYEAIRSDKALDALKGLTDPNVQVIRNGKAVMVASDEIVINDVMLVSEGQLVGADGRVLYASDFSADESILTGESVSVSKTTENPNNQVFAGTICTSGQAYVQVTAIGQQTELGKIGKSMRDMTTEKTPLQRQISRFVLRMAWIGAGAFVLVWGINYARTGDWVVALLFGLTLAMSILPEEIPVAFSSFMALGAARMSRMGILTKQPQTVESLGSATVICTDKTGTLTQDGMTVRSVYDAQTQTIIPVAGLHTETAKHLIAVARWASETTPFDPMEKAVVSAFDSLYVTQPQSGYPMVHEYPLAGTPPMMTHIRQLPGGEHVIAGKGAVEHIAAVCSLSAPQAAAIQEITRQLSADGLRVLGVAQGKGPYSPWPDSQDDFDWTFLGLIALENPPKPNANSVISAFEKAHIQVKMITGDYPETAQAIARQIGLPASEHYLTGQQVMAMPEAQLRQDVQPVHIFARMFPEAKLRVVEALKANGEVVAMTGDGVNDGPALKAAHIGVAMGRRGSELAKQAASLVLVNDDLGAMVEAIAQGRRIYQNLKKAISYIVSIHIPIILTVALPLLFDWKLTNLFSPIHVIFLELVMGPTCSIAFENEPAESDTMRRPPRALSKTFLGGAELSRSIAQGLGITAAVLGVYYAGMQQGFPAAEVRTLVFTTLVLSNMLLTLINRSFTHSVFAMLAVPNRLLWLMITLTALLLMGALYVPAAQALFGFTPISGALFGWCLGAAVAGTGWVELLKALKNK